MNIKKSDTGNPELSSKFYSLLLKSWRPTQKEIQTQKAMPIDERLRREGIYYYKETIHLQPKEWLIKKLGPGQEYPVNVSKLIKNIIWQIRTRIIQKQQPLVKGLILSFWFAYIKPILSRTNSLNQRVDQYHQMIQRS